MMNTFSVRSHVRCFSLTDMALPHRIDLLDDLSSESALLHSSIDAISSEPASVTKARESFK